MEIEREAMNEEGRTEGEEGIEREEKEREEGKLFYFNS